MQRSIYIASAQLVIAIATALLLSGCGGAGSYNNDYGVTLDRNGHKIITRTLENSADMDLHVELRLNGSDWIDDFRIRAHDEATVEISHLLQDDYISFHATFENDESTDGSFSEDGRTVFTYTPERSAGGHASSVSQNGAAAVSRTDQPLRVTPKRQSR